MKENFSKEMALRLWELLTSRPYAPLPLPLYDAELGAGRWPKIARAAGGVGGGGVVGGGGGVVAAVAGGTFGAHGGGAHVSHAVHLAGGNESRAQQRERARVERARDERKAAVLTGRQGPGTAPKRAAAK